MGADFVPILPLSSSQTLAKRPVQAVKLMLASDGNGQSVLGDIGANIVQSAIQRENIAISFSADT